MREGAIKVNLRIRDLRSETLPEKNMTLFLTTVSSLMPSLIISERQAERERGQIVG